MFNLNRMFIKQSPDDGGGAPPGTPTPGTPPPGTPPPADDTPPAGGITLESLRDENMRMRAKMDELLSETKTAKAAKRALEDQALLDADNKAKQDGDYEQLFKSSESKVTSLTSELETLRTSMTGEKKDSAVLRIAGELADGDDAENLAALISKRLKYHEGEMKVLNDKGELTVSSIEDFKNEIKSTPRYKSLLRGSQANGGGAPGNRAGGATTKTATRAEFDVMNHGSRAKFFADGGKVI